MATDQTKAQSKSRKARRSGLRKRLMIAGIAFSAILVALLAMGIWLASKASTIRAELQSATSLMPTLKSQVASNDPEAARATVDALVKHTGTAREAAHDPLWKAAAALPWLGANFGAASEVATSADDVARLGAVPLVTAFQSVDWKALTPSAEGMDLAPLKTSAPKVQSAARTISESAQRLNNIDTAGLLPAVAEPLIDAREKLKSLETDLSAAADTAELAPDMLGATSPRRYLLFMQNNAESRASGGIPGALAVLHLDRGKLTLESQTSALALGVYTPPIAIEPEQQTIYSARIGKFMQDVNLTPDFPTSASTALKMWEKSTGEQLDGVISLDPVALSYILDATGPVTIKDPALREIGSQLPPQLTGGNVVKTLLSDVYAKIAKPELQDVYFAGAAHEIFSTLSTGNTDAKRLLDGISKGVQERRVLLWSNIPSEQETIAKYGLGGSIAGPSVSPTQFGVYFNDGTGAKMDFWMKRSVQIIKDCTRDGYREVTVRVTSTNAAPADASTSLPRYVTGGGSFGVPAGTVQTNIVVYGPVQANIDTVVRDGDKVAFAAQRHSQRAVGTSTLKLSPGQSATLDFNFGHIVQQGSPQVVVTPTTQPTKDVVKSALEPSCE
ncbi:hypothetical protein J2T11_002674 [Paenarthrobacter nicotinovorans]|uniref:DUF4012 domain-containing protein n=1 Tax=Paenarthrobacter nicotinovorans TaxID=29320 RepID=UPI0027892664|nr:DUF4012 domain-containing protein [Paenarthrobacter nicotinovorans]MDP9936312.1 hypothetical protein [Paenarthrobacter nicotinovorans]